MSEQEKELETKLDQLIELLEYVLEQLSDGIEETKLKGE